MGTSMPETTTAPYCTQIAGMPGAYRVRTSDGEAAFEPGGCLWRVDTDGSFRPLGSVRGLSQDHAAVHAAELLRAAAAAAHAERVYRTAEALLVSL